MSTTQPLESLTSLRFLAAASIVVFHYGRDVPCLSWGRPLLDVANSAVSFFFMLSGFILAHVYEPRRTTSLREFYVARFGRIAPLYYLGLAVALVHSLRNGDARISDIGLSILFLQSWVPGHSQALNSPGWSLSVEVAFYAAFPALLAGLRDRKSATIAIVGIAAWALNTAIHATAVLSIDRMSTNAHLWVDATFYHPIGHAGTFVAGITGGLLHRRFRAMFDSAAPAFFAAGAATILIAPVVAGDFVLRFHHNGMLTPAYLAIVVGAAGLRGMTGAILGSRPMLMLGEASYGIYILQHPVHIVYHSILARIGADPPPGLSFAIYATLLLATSIGAYHAIETPARKWIRAFSRQ